MVVPEPHELDADVVGERGTAEPRGSLVGDAFVATENAMKFGIGSIGLSKSTSELSETQEL